MAGSHVVGALVRHRVVVRRHVHRADVVDVFGKLPVHDHVVVKGRADANRTGFASKDLH